jgi:hypothetical protein
LLGARFINHTVEAEKDETGRIAGTTFEFWFRRLTVTVNSENQEETTPKMRFTPSLETAIARWRTAQKAYLHERCGQYQNGYCKATDELGQAIS